MSERFSRGRGAGAPGLFSTGAESGQEPSRHPDTEPAGKPAGKAASSAWAIAFCDGGSRGNPGPSGFGVLVEDEQGRVLAELSEFLGKRTNNFAEYSGLLAALQFAIDNGHGQLRVVSDSELMVKQIKGQYRVNSPELKSLYDEAKRRIARLERFRIEHVLRNKNKRADALANLAMDRGMERASAAPDAGVRPSRAGVPASVAGDALREAVAGADGLPSEGQKPAAGTPSRAHSPRVLAPLRGQEIRGFVKGGVVHLVEGELPDGVFVKILRED